MAADAVTEQVLGHDSLHAVEIGPKDGMPVIFAHGWGRSHHDFIPVAESLAPICRSILLDLPGFGQTPRPDGDWGTADYADFLQSWVRDSLGVGRFIWVGHSFGGRIGLRLGSRRAQGLESLILVASHGIKLPRKTTERWKGAWRQRRFKALKAKAATEAEIIDLERRYGSIDYVASRESGLRDIFVKTVSEDQSEALPRINVPTTLIYGGQDVDTPPALGRAIAGLIDGADYVECAPYDHISVLDRGRHQIALAVKEAVRRAEA